MSDTEAAGAPETGTEASEAAPENDGGQREEREAFDASPWRSLAEETGLSPEQVRKRLEHSRTWEARAKENREAAQAAKTLEQRVNELQEAMAQRDLADLERTSRLAVSQVKGLLAESGIKAQDAAPLLEQLDATRLLADGEVDDKAVKRLAESLVRVAGRAAPDPDQGRRGTGGPTDMNSWIRHRAGRL